MGLLGLAKLNKNVTPPLELQYTQEYLRYVRWRLWIIAFEYLREKHKNYSKGEGVKDNEGQYLHCRCDEAFEALYLRAPGGERTAQTSISPSPSILNPIDGVFG